MNCSIASPTERREFTKLNSITVDTLTGGREILTGHIALITALKDGSLIELKDTEGKVDRIEVSGGSFLQFEHDNALVLTSRFAVEEPKDG